MFACQHPRGKGEKGRGSGAFKEKSVEIPGKQRGRERVYHTEWAPEITAVGEAPPVIQAPLDSGLRQFQGSNWEA